MINKKYNNSYNYLIENHSEFENDLTPYHKLPNPNECDEEGFYKHCRKRRKKAGNKHFLPLQQNFLPYQGEVSSVWGTYHWLSANLMLLI